VIETSYNPRFGALTFLLEVRHNTVTSLGTEAYRGTNTYRDASGDRFHPQGDAAPYAYEGVIFDGNTAINAMSAYGSNPGVDGFVTANATNTSVLRDTYDISHRDGTWVGTPGWNGGSLTLSGTNYINLSYPAGGTLSNLGTLNFPATMTIEGKFKTTGTNGILISNIPIGDAAVTLDGSGKISVFASGFTSSIKTAVANNGAWHHFAWSSAPGSQKLYLDGVLAASAAYTRVTPGIGRGWLGSQNNTSNFVGQLADLRVWETERTGAQILAFKDLNLAGDETGLTQYWRFAETSGIRAHNGVLSSPLSAGLVAYWRYDENTGSSIIDSSGNGNTGTLNGTPSWTTG
jgi:hypothetical protein